MENYFFDGFQYDNSILYAIDRDGNAELVESSYQNHRELCSADGELEIPVIDGTAVLPEEIHGHPLVTVWENALENLDDCRTLVIPNSVTRIFSKSFYHFYASYSFSESELCSSGIKEIVVAPDHPALEVRDGVLIDKQRKSIIFCPESKEGHYTVPEGIVSIDDCAFRGCRITGVTLASTVCYVCSGAFSGCRELKLVDGVRDDITFLGNPFAGTVFATSTVSTVRWKNGALVDASFRNQDCPRFHLQAERCGTRLPLPHEITVALPEHWQDQPLERLEFGSMEFVSCHTLVIPNSLTTIEPGAFVFNTSMMGNGSYVKLLYLSRARITTVRIAEDHPTLRLVDGVLFDKTSHTLLFCFDKKPGQHYVVPEGTARIAAHAFHGCEFAKITLPDSLQEIGECAFLRCYQMVGPDNLRSTVLCKEHALTIVPPKTGSISR